MYHAPAVRESGNEKVEISLRSPRKERSGSPKKERIRPDGKISVIQVLFNLTGDIQFHYSCCIVKELHLSVVIQLLSNNSRTPLNFDDGMRLKDAKRVETFLKKNPKNRGYPHRLGSPTGDG
jgi:hypothetical protein